MPAVGGAAGSLGNTGGLPPTAGSDGSAGVPIAWGCPREAYSDGQCHCGCALPDPDCASDELDACEVCDAVGSCNKSACPGHVDPDDVTTCVPPPTGWTCAPSAYDDGATCDCGCGIADADCADGELSSCQTCDGSGSCGNGPCPSSIAIGDTATCEYPARWLCSETLYGDGTCDCGCAEPDIDCPDANASSCVRAPPGGCAAFDQLELLNAADNTTCSVPPSGWYCDERVYNSGGQCDCGCGAVDLDCASADRDECMECNGEGSCSSAACPGAILATDNAHCAPW